MAAAAAASGGVLAAAQGAPPLPQGFATLWEGGLRVPLLLHWPAALGPGGRPAPKRPRGRGRFGDADECLRSMRPVPWRRAGRLRLRPPSRAGGTI